MTDHQRCTTQSIALYTRYRVHKKRNPPCPLVFAAKPLVCVIGADCGRAWAMAVENIDDDFTCVLKSEVEKDA